MLQHRELRASTKQEHAKPTHCNTLQHTATHCSTQQHTAAHCNTLQHTATHCNAESYELALDKSTQNQHTATYCNTLQHTAKHCNTLQHTATLCNTESYELVLDKSTLDALLCTDHASAFFCEVRLIVGAPLFCARALVLQGSFAIRAHTATCCNILQHTATTHSSFAIRANSTPSSAPITRRLSFVTSVGFLESLLWARAVSW